MTAKVNAVKAVYDDQVAQLADLDAQLAEIQAEEVAKAAQLADRKALLADHIRAAYDSDRTSLIETILSADSFSDALADVGYLIDIGDQDRALAGADREGPADALRPAPDGRAGPASRRASCGPQTAAQKKVLDKSLADLRKARAKLQKLEKETARQLALQTKAYKTIARQQDRGAGDPGRARHARTPQSIARSSGCRPTRSAAAASRPSTAARSSGRCRARSPRSSAVPASPGSRPTATAPTSTRASTSPRRWAADPGRRPGPGALRRSAVGRGLDGDHRPQRAPHHAVRPRQRRTSRFAPVRSCSRASSSPTSG